MAHVLAGGVIGAHLHPLSNRPRKRHRQALLARPAALASGRAAREAPAPDQGLEQSPDFGRVFGYAGAPDVVEPTIRVVEPEQEMLYGLRAALSVEAADDAIDRLPELELAHGALARQVAPVEPLGDDAVQSLLAEPAARDGFLLGRLAEAEGGSAPALSTKAASAGRRSASGRSISGEPETSRRSKATSCAGVCPESLRMRLSAGAVRQAGAGLRDQLA